MRRIQLNAYAWSLTQGLRTCASGAQAALRIQVLSLFPLLDHCVSLEYFSHFPSAPVHSNSPLMGERDKPTCLASTLPWWALSLVSHLNSYWQRAQWQRHLRCYSSRCPCRRKKNRRQDDGAGRLSSQYARLTMCGERDWAILVRIERTTLIAHNLWQMGMVA